MPRPTWKGNISFGLVNVPVSLYSAEQRSDLSLRLIDSRNNARVRYVRVNEETGEEVPWDNIVKGFEYDGGNYVLLSDEEMESVSVEMTRTIEIEEFVELSEIDIRYFDRPYLLVPGKNGEKGYVLLREAIANKKKTGIARVVIRTRQYLAAMVAVGDALLLELLRYEQELKDLEDYDLPSSDLRKVNVSKKEIDLAEQLIDGMAAEWDPSKYEDEYRTALMEMIDRKIETGETEAIEIGEEEAPEEATQAINFMDVLRRSVDASSGKKTAKRGGKKKASTKSKKRAS